MSHSDDVSREQRFETNRDAFIAQLTFSDGSYRMSKPNGGFYETSLTREERDVILSAGAEYIGLRWPISAYMNDFPENRGARLKEIKEAASTALRRDRSAHQIETEEDGNIAQQRDRNTHFLLAGLRYLLGKKKLERERPMSGT